MHILYHGSADDTRTHIVKQCKVQDVIWNYISIRYIEITGLGRHTCIIVYGAKTIFVTIRFYLKLPISEFTCILLLFTNTELTIPVIVTEIISSCEFSPVLYQQKKGSVL